MSIQPSTQDPTPDLSAPLTPSQPLPVTVNINAIGEVTVSPDPIKIPWLFAGNVVLKVVSDDPSVRFNGVTFADPDAPFVVDVIDPAICLITAVNDNPAQTGPVLGVGTFSFTISLLSANGPISHDPTVENDSPPPVED